MYTLSLNEEQVRVVREAQRVWEVIINHRLPTFALFYHLDIPYFNLTYQNLKMAECLCENEIFEKDIYPETFKIRRGENSFLMEMEEKDFKNLSRLLDFFGRIHLRQFNIIGELMRYYGKYQTAEPRESHDDVHGDRNPSLDIFLNTMAIMDILLDEVCRWSMRKGDERDKNFPSYGRPSLSITNDEVNNDARIARDIEWVIRHRLAWDKNPKPEFKNWHYDQPNSLSKFTLPAMDKKEA